LEIKELIIKGEIVVSLFLGIEHFYQQGINVTDFIFNGKRG